MPEYIGNVRSIIRMESVYTGWGLVRRKKFGCVEPFPADCVYQNLIRIDGMTNRLSWRNDRADPLSSGHADLTIQVQEPA